MSAEETAHARTVVIDGRTYRITVPTQSGAQLKALAERDAIYQLFQEAEGPGPDRLIPDHEAVVLQDGQHFYTVPPAMAGAHGPR